MQSSISSSSSFSRDSVSGIITPQQNGKVYVITGKVHDNVKNGKIRYFSAAPMDKITSFSGAGIPFPNPEVAFDNSPNQGEIELTRENSFEIVLSKPNSYYINLGSTFVPPALYIRYNNGEPTDQIVSIQICHAIPFRTLNYPAERIKKGAMFYDDTQFSEKKYSIRTQEQIFRDSAYDPDEPVPSNFWGLKPPA